MRYLTIITLLAATITSCNFNIESSTEALMDSLQVEHKAELGGVITTIYEDTVATESGPGLIYKLTVYNQELASNGVYKLELSLGTFNVDKKESPSLGNLNSLISTTRSGRWSRVAGTPNDPTTIVHRFIDFTTGSDTLNIIYKDNIPTFLNSKFEPLNTTIYQMIPKMHK